VRLRRLERSRKRKRLSFRQESTVVMSVRFVEMFFPVTFLASLLLFNSRTLTAEEDVHVVTTLAGVAESGSTNGVGTNSQFFGLVELRSLQMENMH
jgi:hypothetical protein